MGVGSEKEEQEPVGLKYVRSYEEEKARSLSLVAHESFGKFGAFG